MDFPSARVQPAVLTLVSFALRHAALCMLPSLLLSSANISIVWPFKRKLVFIPIHSYLNFAVRLFSEWVTISESSLVNARAYQYSSPSHVPHLSFDLIFFFSLLFSEPYLLKKKGKLSHIIKIFTQDSMDLKCGVQVRALNTVLYWGLSLFLNMSNSTLDRH